MSGIIVSILFSFAVQLVRFGITALYEARKLRRPNIRDKEGLRAYLENLLRWAAYVHQSFFPDLATPGFTLGILLEIVKPGEKWDAFYAALIHDFNISQHFPPEKYGTILSDSAGLKDDRDSRIRFCCLCLRKPADRLPAHGRFGETDVSDLEKQMAEEYLALVRRLLDHPAVLDQAQRTYAGMRSSPNGR